MLDLTIPANAEEWAHDLELMHHYATTVYDIVGSRENVAHLWRDYIPQQAIKHRFLMHGLLALAALHLAYLRPDLASQHLQTFDKHQAIALEKFRSILSSPACVDPMLADALFALSGTLSVSSMAATCTRMCTDAAIIDIDTITELFTLTRGIRDVIHLSYEHIRTGPMAALLENQRYPEATETNLPPSVSNCLEAVERMLITSGVDPNATQHCQVALAELERIYHNIAYILGTADANVELGDVSRWQVLVPMDYIRLVQARNPPTLIILAHYVATMTAVHTAWYTQNWAGYALRGISQSLDGSMQHWLRWPMAQVEDRLKVLRAQADEREAIVSTR